jgi:hypothetical protein
VPLTEHIALVSLTSDIPLKLLLQASAAFQKQISRDFEPIWGVAATVDAFEDLASVPNDYHHVVLFDDPNELAERLSWAIGQTAAARLINEFEREGLQGIHLNEFTRQPFALVAVSETWTVTTSHEVLELVADPYGNHLRAAAHPRNRAKRVNCLVEVCDPCQAVWYHVNGVPVSDFYTPWYFEPVQIDGLRYSFTGELKEPLQVLDGGYLSWIDPTDSGLYQYLGGDSEPRLVASSTDLRRSSTALRTIVDTDPRTPRPLAWEALRAAGTVAAPSTANLALREASEGIAQRIAQAFVSLTSERR